MKNFIHKLKRWKTLRNLILMGIELHKRAIAKDDNVKAAYYAARLYEDCYQMGKGPRVLCYIFYTLHRKDLKELEKFYDSFTENGFA